MIQIELEHLDFISRATIELSHAMGRMAKVGPNITIVGSNRITADSPLKDYYHLAMALAARLGREGYHCITGGGSGITEAVIEGAAQAKTKSIALRLVPSEFRIQRLPDVRVKITNPFNRKVLYDLFSEAHVFFPGGFATLDALFEALTLRQTRKTDWKPIVCVGKDFWTRLLNPLFEACIKFKTIDASDRDLFVITDSVDEILSVIQKHRGEVLKDRGEGGLALARSASSKRAQGFAHKVAMELALSFSTFYGVGEGITIFGSARTKPESAIYYETVLLAQELGKALVQRRDRSNLRGAIITGGGPGNMEAANKGARLAGAPSLGLGIDLAMEHGFNPYVDNDLAYEFRYFFSRKWLFSVLTDIFIATPGGFGTFDELFEMIANKQHFFHANKLLAAKSIYCVNHAFWDEPLRATLDLLLEHDFIPKDYHNLIEPVCDTPEAIAKVRKTLLSETGACVAP